jgi:hypothetical protein
MENIEHNAILNQMESKASFYHTWRRCHITPKFVLF